MTQQPALELITFLRRLVDSTPETNSETNSIIWTPLKRHVEEVLAKPEADFNAIVTEIAENAPGVFSESTRVAAGLGPIPATIQAVIDSTDITSGLAAGPGLLTTGTTISLDDTTQSKLDNNFDTAGDGLESVGNRVSVKLDSTGGLKFDATNQGLPLKLATSSSGLTLTGGELAVQLETNKGLATGASGLAVQVDGTTIGFDGNGQLRAIGGGSGFTTAGDGLEASGTTVNVKIVQIDPKPLTPSSTLTPAGLRIIQDGTGDDETTGGLAIDSITQAAVNKVGTEALTTAAQDLSAAINELKIATDSANTAAIPVGNCVNDPNVDATILREVLCCMGIASGHPLLHNVRALLDRRKLSI